MGVGVIVIALVMTWVILAAADVRLPEGDAYWDRLVTPTREHAPTLPPLTAFENASAAAAYCAARWHSIGVEFNGAPRERALTLCAMVIVSGSPREDIEAMLSALGVTWRRVVGAVYAVRVDEQDETFDFARGVWCDAGGETCRRYSGGR
jgi:hypothetical protein